jgi:GAF domain-containing protein
MSGIAAPRIAEVFVEMADTLVEGFDLIDFLQRLTQRTSELASVSAAGLLLADVDGKLRFMAASDERTYLLELVQVQADQGPCRDCFRTGEPVMEGNLTSGGDRWPDFTPRAIAAGFSSVHAFPLRLRGEVIGALGLFNSSSRTPTPAYARVVQALADMATIALLQERAIRRGEMLSEQLQGALNSRIVIEQAKGAIAQLYGVTVDDAFGMLREYVRRNRLRLTDVARTVITDPVNAPDLTSRSPR